MNKQSLEKRMLDTMEKIEKLMEHERKIHEMPAHQVIKRREDMQKTSLLMQNSFDSLRVMVKYLLFDLEVTKVEKKC